MSAITRTLADVAARVAFRSAEVTAVTDVGDRFRTIELAGDALRGVDWTVGDKIQVRTDPDGIAARTYTPVDWDPDRGATRLLTHSHGDGPGSRWAASVAVGDRCQLFGPRRSLALDKVTAPLVLVGDETSFALAAAWEHHGPGTPALAAIFEVADPEAARDALRAVGVHATRLVVRTADGDHRSAMAETVVDVIRAHPDAVLCLTGRAQTIAFLRRTLKAGPVAGRTTLVKAYWDENRTGLD